MRKLVGLILAMTAWGAAGPCPAQTLKPGEVLSSVAVQVLSAPHPVAGADGRTHLAYEMLVVNPGHVFVQIDKVEALDQGERGLWSVEGDRLRAMTTRFSGGDGWLPPGGSETVFMDVPVAPGVALPTRLSARLTISRQAVGPDGKPAPFPADAPVPAQVSFVGAETPVGRPATLVAPPLRGGNWVASNGCCDSITPHRRANMAVNGQLRVPERFAIDWVQIDDSGRAFTGEAAKLANWRYYGTPIHSATAGVVVNLYDSADEQVPGAPMKGITPENIGGNMLVVDAGAGVFAFYAHLQRGSLRVRLGDRVEVGQVIGLLGNTGNSTAPHLHFHLMDGPSPLDANGLPFVFTRFRSRGVLASGGDDALERGEAARIETDRLTGEHVNQMPMNDQVVDFN